MKVTQTWVPETVGADAQAVELVLGFDPEPSDFPPASLVLLLDLSQPMWPAVNGLREHLPAICSMPTARMRLEVQGFGCDVRRIWDSADGTVAPLLIPDQFVGGGISNLVGALDSISPSVRRLIVVTDGSPTNRLGQVLEEYTLVTTALRRHASAGGDVAVFVLRRPRRQPLTEPFAQAVRDSGATLHEVVGDRRLGSALRVCILDGLSRPLELRLGILLEDRLVREGPARGVGGASVIADEPGELCLRVSGGSVVVPLRYRPTLGERVGRRRGGEVRWDLDASRATMELTLRVAITPQPATAGGAGASTSSPTSSGAG